MAPIAAWWPELGVPGLQRVLVGDGNSKVAGAAWAGEASVTGGRKVPGPECIQGVSIRTVVQVDEWNV